VSLSRCGKTNSCGCGRIARKVAALRISFFPILMHPDTSGMAHIMGMAERVMVWLKSWGDSVEFCTHEEIAREWLAEQRAKAG